MEKKPFLGTYGRLRLPSGHFGFLVFLNWSQCSWNESPGYQEEVGLAHHNEDKEDSDAERWTALGVSCLRPSPMFQDVRVDISTTL